MVNAFLFYFTRFSLFNGNISGKFLELSPNSKIGMLWRYKQWPSGHYSTVTIDIDQKVILI